LGICRPIADDYILDDFCLEEHRQLAYYEGKAFTRGYLQDNYAEEQDLQGKAGQYGGKRNLQELWTN
jgi:hypothetical protein